METTTTQNFKILEHLKTGKTITPIDALMEFHCLRLAARVFNLREQGWPIHTDRITNGEKTYAEYSLNQDKKTWPN